MLKVGSVERFLSTASLEEQDSLVPVVYVAVELLNGLSEGNSVLSKTGSLSFKCKQQ